MTPLELFLAEEDLPEKVVWKSFRGYSIPIEDMISEARVGLWEAAISYKPELGMPFGAFAMKCIYGQLLNMLTVAKRKLEWKAKRFSLYETIGLPDLTYEDILGKDFTIGSVEANELWEKVMSDPILRLRAQGFSWKQIAEKTGLSFSWVTTKGSRNLRKLRSDCAC